MATPATRAGLIDAATRAFAEEGVLATSLVEVTRRAGLKHRGAVHYHFGGRDGLLVAVLDPHVELLARREGELLAVARTKPDDDVASVVEAIVRPAVELAESGWRGRCCLAIVAELVEQDPATHSAEVADALTRTGGYEVYGLLAQRMPSMDDALRMERFALLTSFVLGAVARRARADESSRPQLPRGRFVDHLVDLATAIVTARVR